MLYILGGLVVHIVSVGLMPILGPGVMSVGT